jgi:hypothetical protein
MFHAQCLEREVGILLAATFNPDFFRIASKERDPFFACEFEKSFGRLVNPLHQRMNVPHGLDGRVRRRAVELRNWLAH